MQTLNHELAAILKLPRLAKQGMVLVLDIVAAMITLWLAFYLRLDQIGLPQGDQIYVYLMAVLGFIPVFIFFGLYRTIFRYTGIPAIVTMTCAVGVYGVLLFISLLVLQLNGVPRSVGIIQPVLFLLLSGAWRVAARYVLSTAGGKASAAHTKNKLLIYGAGEAGVQTAFALDVMRQYQVLGFIDDDVAKIGRTINGVPIISPDKVEGFVLRYGITDILLAIPSLQRHRRREIIDALTALSVHVRSLPGMLDLASGNISVADFQELDVEDLLGRPPVKPDHQLLAKNLRDKVVLVTGAGGSIGSELCRQIVQERPRQLILLEHNEFGLYAIHGELEGMCKERGFEVQIIPRLASIRNLGRLRGIFRQFQPQSVYHAAAYKHVPMVQSNPSEGIFNNVFGTLNAARAAMEAGVENFVLISTDKAVRPTNVMGATKRMAELVLQAMAEAQSVDFSRIDLARGELAEPAVANRTNFCMVRFGNVLGSSGSVVPLFRSQLKRGGPLTVTHKDVIRYFMTIPEAAQLVLQAGAMGKGGEVFVLDMGKPVKIMDLARRMIQLSGMTVKDEAHPGGDIAIEVVGLRPGEKLYEELLIGDNPEGTDHERIMKAHEQYLSWPELLPHLLRLRAAAREGEVEAIHKVFTQLVSGYRKSC